MCLPDIDTNFDHSVNHIGVQQLGVSVRFLTVITADDRIDALTSV